MGRPLDYWVHPWFVDPESGTMYEATELGNFDTLTGRTAEMDELTAGGYSAGVHPAGGFLRDETTNRFVESWGFTQEAWAKLNTAGDLTMLHPVEIDEVNSAVYPRRQYGTFITGDVTLPTGETHRVESTSWFTRSGDRLLVRPDVARGQSGRYAYFKEINPQATTFPDEPPPGFAWAESEETAMRGQIGAIISQEKHLIDDMIALGITDENGDPILTTYDMAEYILRTTGPAPMYTASLFPANAG